MARMVTIHRTSDGREFANHTIEDAKVWQRYLNALAQGHDVPVPVLTSEANAQTEE